VAERLAGVVDSLRWSPPGQAGALFDSRQETGLESVYWRKMAITHRVPDPDPDPDRDRCGVIWLAPVLPFAGDHVQRCVAMIEDRMRGHPFEPSIGLQGHSPRSVYLTIAIVYDRESAGQDALAMACYRDLLDHLGGAGYLPYRLGIQSMAGLPAGDDDTPAVLAAIKRALDPQSILAPGRYDFAAEQP
jgi:4-cresol dehydrogenase (hydroxylating)